MNVTVEEILNAMGHVVEDDKIKADGRTTPILLTIPVTVSEIAQSPFGPTTVRVRVGLREFREDIPLSAIEKIEPVGATWHVQPLPNKRTSLITDRLIRRGGVTFRVGKEWYEVRAQFHRDTPTDRETLCVRIEDLPLLLLAEEVR